MTHVSHRSRIRVTLASVGLAALGAGLLTPIARAADAPGTRTPVYIALGDSYTSAPLISKPVGKWGGPSGYNNPDDPDGPPIAFTTEPAPGVRDYNGALL